jgi:hypothetical protein
LWAAFSLAERNSSIEQSRRAFVFARQARTRSAMRYSTTIILSACIFAATSAALSADQPLDCSKKSLATAVADFREKDPAITFTGVCAGPIEIRTAGVTLQGVGQAIIDGGGQDAVTVAGAGRVSLSGFEVRNGLNGIVAVNGAHLSLDSLTVHDNTGSGISIQTASSVVLTDVTTAQNGLHGLDVHSGSAATVNGVLDAIGNRVFGINVNGSSITFAKATVSATANALGIQIATNANAFLAGPDSVISATNNIATGLTIVSGAHLVSFGGTITASGNPGVGVSVNSKSGLDLDAGSTLNSVNNGDGVLIQQNSVMTVFNTPQFSGAPGFSTINANNNTRTGVRVLTDAVLTLVNQARVNSTQNGTTGFVADNGAGVTLVNSAISGNTAVDILLTFGARADVRTTTFGSYTCDATVLVRGGSPITCPH